MQYSEISLDALGRLIKADDRLALKELFSRYEHQLYLFALKKLKNDEDAEMILQKVLTSLWEKRAILEIDAIEDFLYSGLQHEILVRLSVLMKDPEKKQFVIDNLLPEFQIAINNLIQKDPHFKKYFQQILGNTYPSNPSTISSPVYSLLLPHLTEMIDRYQRESVTDEIILLIATWMELH